MTPQEIFQDFLRKESKSTEILQISNKTSLVTTTNSDICQFVNMSKYIV